MSPYNAHDMWLMIPAELGASNMYIEKYLLCKQMIFFTIEQWTYLCII